MRFTGTKLCSMLVINTANVKKCHLKQCYTLKKVIAQPTLNRMSFLTSPRPFSYPRSRCPRGRGSRLVVNRVRSTIWALRSKIWALNIIQTILRAASRQHTRTRIVTLTLRESHASWQKRIT